MMGSECTTVGSCVCGLVLVVVNCAKQSFTAHGGQNDPGAAAATLAVRPLMRERVCCAQVLFGIFGCPIGEK